MGLWQSVPKLAGDLMVRPWKKTWWGLAFPGPSQGTLSSVFRAAIFTRQEAAIGWGSWESLPHSKAPGHLPFIGHQLALGSGCQHTHTHITSLVHRRQVNRHEWHPGVSPSQMEWPRRTGRKAEEAVWWGQELLSGWLLALAYIPTLPLWGHICDYAMEKQRAW